MKLGMSGKWKRLDDQNDLSIYFVWVGCSLFAVVLYGCVEWSVDDTEVLGNKSCYV